MLNSVEGLSQTSRVQVMSNIDRPLRENAVGKMEVDWDLYDKMRDEYPISVDHKTDMISFKMMTKPAEMGGSGAQLTDLIEVALHQLKYLHNKFPCKYNEFTISSLEQSLFWQGMRTADRENRGVEGKDEA